VFLTEEYYFSTTSAAPVILDCGANIGLTSLYLMSCYPDARITAFEPHPVTYATLCHNIERNHLANVTPVNAALTAKGDVATIYDHASTPGDVCASTNTAIHDRRMRASQDRVQFGATKVRAVRLSEYIQGDVDLLKLDIEGAELDVLLEAEQSLHHVRQMLIEWHHAPGTTSLASFLALLERQGFHYTLRGVLSPPLSNRVDDIATLLVYAAKPAVLRRAPPTHNACDALEEGPTVSSQ
jgi:FkbM family methyltransferase